MKRADCQSVTEQNRKKGFLCVPNDLLDDLYSDRWDRRSKALVRLCLLRHIYFTDGEIVFNRRRIPCLRGEWVTTFRQLEQKTSVPRSTIDRSLKQLEKEGCIYIRHEGRYSFIRYLWPDLPEPAAGKVPGSNKGGPKPSAGKPSAAPPPSITDLPNYKRFKD